MDEEWLFEEIKEIDENKKHKYKLEDYTHIGEYKNPICGDHIKIYIKMKKNIITKISFEGKGCVISQVSAELLCRELENKTLKHIQNIEMGKILPIKVSGRRIECRDTSYNAVLNIKEIFALKIHKTPYGDVVGAADKELLGKTFKEDKKILDIKESFYYEKDASLEEIIDAINKSFTANIVGDNIISKLSDKGAINKENAKEIQKIKYIHIYKIEG